MRQDRFKSDWNCFDQIGSNPIEERHEDSWMDNAEMNL